MLADLARCNLQNLANIEISLEVYCYMEGLREKILEKYAELKEAGEEANELVANVETHIQDIIDKTPRFDIKNYFSQIME